jgi:hypothetical protein
MLKCSKIAKSLPYGAYSLSPKDNVRDASEQRLTTNTLITSVLRSFPKSSLATSGSFATYSAFHQRRVHRVKNASHSPTTFCGLHYD